MFVKQAVVRQPGVDFAAGITTANLGKPDLSLALKQHDAYIEALAKLGVAVTVLPAALGYPDAPFVEDTAVVTEKGAVLTRPGALSRRDEVDSVAEVLKGRLPLKRIEDPGATLDGGDVLRVESKFIIGLTPRTNERGAQQLAAQLRAWGYEAEFLKVERYLHLKTAANYIGKGNLLVTRSLADAQPFAQLNRILVEDDEEYAANSIFVNGTLLMPAGYSRLRAQLAALAYPIVELELSEFRKLDGGMTCLSLLQ